MQVHECCASSVHSILFVFLLFAIREASPPQLGMPKGSERENSMGETEYLEFSRNHLSTCLFLYSHRTLVLPTISFELY